MARAAARTLNVDVSAESYAGWERFARDNGVTMASTVEAVGLAISAGGLPGPLFDEVVSIARQVAAERRSRRRP
jgi:hypothetical protein